MSVVIPQELVERLAAAKRVAVLTGAGISAESGIPTFRDALTGLWANYDPQELATPEGFARNPKLVWEWYAERRARIAGVQPNPGHAALAALQQRFARFTLVTQNIDSLHQRAGSREVVELHGNIARVKCSRE
ncbi:partial NAD-dependent protein deacylase, partial [Rhodocyclaceae bacterium]